MILITKCLSKDNKSSGLLNLSLLLQSIFYFYICMCLLPRDKHSSSKQKNLCKERVSNKKERVIIFNNNINDNY